MVHYNLNPTHVVHTPPPVCPKCGSHRTQIVGTSESGILTIRCNSCGERSTVSFGSRETLLGGDDVAADLAVMQAVGRALAQLQDPEAPTRVLP